jgi:hypothetical protein
MAYLGQLFTFIRKFKFKPTDSVFRMRGDGVLVHVMSAMMVALQVRKDRV